MKMAGVMKGATFVVLVFSMFAELVYCQTCQTTDSFALQYFSQELPLAGKEFVTWVPGTDCCTWDGVTCDASGHVIYLHIVNQDVHVPSPPGTDYLIGSGLGDLQSLRNLTMINMPLDGEIPPSWGGLSNLQVLNIDSCNVAGGLPSQLCLLNLLEIFIVKDNYLNGTVAECFLDYNTTFPVLKSMNMSGNLFTGPVPSPF